MPSFETKEEAIRFVASHTYLVSSTKQQQRLSEIHPAINTYMATMEVQGAETLAQRFQLQLLDFTPKELTGYEGFVAGDFIFDFEIDQVETWFTRNDVSLEETKVEPVVNFDDTIECNDEGRDTPMSGCAIVSFLLITVLILLYARKRCLREESDYNRA